MRMDIALFDRIPMHLVVDGGWGYSTRRTDEGNVFTHAATLGLGISYTEEIHRIKCSMGPRIDGGWGWTEGRHPVEGISTASGSGFLLTVLWDVSLKFHFTKRFLFFSEFLLGHVLVGLDPYSDGISTGGVKGPMLGVESGLSVKF